MRPASDILQRRRTRRQKRIAGEHRKDRQRIENESTGTIPPHLSNKLNPFGRAQWFNVGRNPLADKAETKVSSFHCFHHKSVR